QPGRLPMVAGLALLDAVERLAPALTTGLKWPNDLLVGENPAAARKAAGILVESVIRDGRVESALVGIGINVNQMESELPQVQAPARTPTSLALELGTPIDRTELLIALCRAFAAHLLEPDGNLVGRWRSRLWTLGRPVTAFLPDGSQIDGLAVDITPTGGLLIEMADGRREGFEAGDVSLRPT
ncbi:MAG: biotin--[acetyl-CoA-carboxylase] ligase, partial [Caldilineaceae bacterium]